MLGTTYELGAALVATPGLEMRVFANVKREVRETYNVLAETRGGDDSNVVMAGAHLDSVRFGPGVNDNGSGSAAILEVARQMRRVQPTNKVRFAWWGAEEAGDIGSIFYVDNLSEQERADIAAYLNFDMIASPNFARFVYSSEGRPAGSAAIEALFTEFYAGRGLASETTTSLADRSDHAPFAAAGIPIGGLFTGAEVIKTEAQRSLYGGFIGPFDPCYHRFCDTAGNFDPGILDLNSDGVAYATLTLAMDSGDVTAASAAASAEAADRPSPASPPFGPLAYA